MPFHGHAGYGYAKRMLDLQIHLLKKQYGCNFTSITPVTIFGPNDNWNFNEGHVVGALVSKCFLAKKNGTPFEVWGSGRAVRQFVFSEDIARVLLEVLETYNEPETVIVSASAGVTIKELAETIAKVMDFRGEIRFDSSKPEGQLIRVLNNDKFQKLFPKFKFSPLEESLKRTVDWYEKNQQ